ncbi:MAG: hypothetical protein JW947_04255 [Sedimentisphaerales bacterium]|nr:hypothetical protein [Sedimentisphaerales bacterium]
MKNSVNKKQPLSLGRRVLLALLLGAMAMLALLMLADYLMEKKLGKEIVKISRASEPTSLLDLQPDITGTAEDAALYYYEALSGVPPGNLENLSKVNAFYRKSIASLPPNQFPSEISEKVEQDLAKLQPVLQKFDKAAALPLTRFDIGIEHGMKVCRTTLNLVHTASLLLSLRTSHLVLKKQDDAAVESLVTNLRLMRVLDQCPIMVLHTAKIVLLVNACQDALLVLEHAQPSDKSLEKLQDALSKAAPSDMLERMFFAERAYQLEIARNLLPPGITSKFLQSEIPPLPERLSLPSTRWGRMRIRQLSVRYLKNIAKLIADAKRPWPQPLDAAAANPAVPGKPPELLTTGAAFINLTAEMLALTRCTILAIAVERYRLRHGGKLPASLNELTPAYIDSVPQDPFTGKDLLFTSDQQTYGLYSVGPNRKDDGGSTTRTSDEIAPLDCGLCIRLQKSQ